jgi:hypothetical protein
MGDKEDFCIKIEFADGSTVSLGAKDEFYAEPEDGSTAVTLNDDRLALIAALQKASEAF